jgi:endonuclease YncB( thermonuclease family)
MNETAVTYTSSATTTSSFTADGQSVDSVTYDGDSNEVNVNGHLITNDGFYIADINGVRIRLGGMPTPDTDGITGTVWTVSSDIV